MPQPLALATDWAAIDMSLVPPVMLRVTVSRSSRPARSSNSFAIWRKSCSLPSSRCSTLMPLSLSTALRCAACERILRVTTKRIFCGLRVGSSAGNRLAAACCETRQIWMVMGLGNGSVRMNLEPLQRSTQPAQFVGTEFATARLVRHGEDQVPVRRAARADLRRQLHRRGADDGVARRDECHVEVRHAAVEGGAVPLHPLQGAGVAADEPSGHGRHCSGLERWKLASQACRRRYWPSECHEGTDSGRYRGRLPLKIRDLRHCYPQFTKLYSDTIGISPWKHRPCTNATFNLV